MRLINIHDFSLREFSSKPPPYVVLSHCWTDDEVSFKDFAKGRFDLQSSGFKKIKRLCDYVQDTKYYWSGAVRSVDWCWVDTCCIDKRSSAELSEAINSMWNIYKASLYCVAYLPDVHCTQRKETTIARLKQSRWFTRGWTLQELLAPLDVIFCDSEWQTIGTLRKNPLLQHAIADVTGIDKEFLVNNNVKLTMTKRVSVAKILSWASHRQTSRPEDMAYCLLGLLDVNMPLLYGEGEMKAFLRLQQMVIAQSDDESIFAWTQDAYPTITYGILADNIRCFRGAGGIEKIFVDSEEYLHRPPYTVTNKGLRFESVAERVQEPVIEGVRIPRSTRLSPFHGTPDPVWLIALNCGFRSPEPGGAESAKSDPKREVKHSPPAGFGERRCVIALQEHSGGIADRVMVNTLCPGLESPRYLSGASEEKSFLIRLADNSPFKRDGQINQKALWPEVTSLLCNV